MHANISKSSLRTKNDKKSLRKRVETLVKKAAELVSSHGVDVLLVVYSKEENRWTDYSSKDPTELFFNFQSAKEHLKLLESKSTPPVHKPPCEANTVSPPPTKRKVRREPSAKLSISTCSGKSTDSTYSFDSGPSITSEQLSFQKEPDPPNASSKLPNQLSTSQLHTTLDSFSQATIFWDLSESVDDLFQT